MSIARPRIRLGDIALVALLGGIVAAPSQAWAQEEGTAAAEAFREGLRLYGQEDYAGARASFEQAYSAQPDARVLANIADCLVHEGDVAQAVMTYRRFLAEAGAEVPAPARRLVERRVQDLRPQVCDLRVTAEPAGASVLVDGVETGTAPVEAPVAVSPGEHRVEVRLAGHGTVTRTVQARAGGDLEVSVVLEPVREEPPPPPEVEPPRPAGPQTPPPTALGRGPLLWTGIGLTAALAIGGTITGVLALSRQSEYEDPHTSVDRRRALYDDRATLPLLTDVLLDSAIVTGLATAGLFLFAGPSDDTDERQSITTVTPRLVRGGGVACDLHFTF